ncbi:MAG: hypothetical protein NTY09_11270 [bacterium]|nr:hypothetical protein [bacterium]
MVNRLQAFILMLIMIIGLVSCSNRNGASVNPVVPGDSNQNASFDKQFTNPTDQPSGHYLLGYNLIYIDPTDSENVKCEMVPLRLGELHLNILKILETGTCTNCFAITGWNIPSPGVLDLDIRITHPFPPMDYTCFDTRGIIMFDGSHNFPGVGLTTSDYNLGDPEMFYPEGFTTLYNGSTLGQAGPFQTFWKGKFATESIPNTQLNGFLRYNTNDAANVRNALYSGESVTRTYSFHLPPSAFTVGYAVDANWDIPLTTPVTDPMVQFPMTANCPEPWKIEVNVTPIGEGLTDVGGSAILSIDVYDWQGSGTHGLPFVECPELFDGGLSATWAGDFPGYTRWNVTVTNEKLADVGEYECLVGVEANENQTSPPYLNLTAYWIHLLSVAEFLVEDNTPQWLNTNPKDVCVNGNYAYIAGDATGVHIFDISDPANPTWVNGLQLSGRCYGIDYDNGYVYVAHSGGFSVIDVDPPETAFMVHYEPINGALYGIKVVYPYAYVTTSDTGIQIYEVDPPGTANLINAVDTDGYSMDVDVTGNYAYVADGNEGLAIIDITVPSSASVVKKVDTPGDAERVKVSGDYAYIADFASGLTIVDISSIPTAYVVTSVPTGHIASDVFYENNYAYVSDGISGLQIINVTDPTTAFIEKTVDTPGNACGVEISNGYACVADYASLRLIDVDPVASANEVGFSDTTGYVNDVAVDGLYSYATSDVAGLKIISNNPPEDAYVLKTVPCPGFSFSVEATGGYAYVTNYGDGVQVIDVDPPAIAYVVMNVPVPGWADGIDIVGNYAYVAAHAGGLSILDITTPGATSVLNTVPTSGEALKVCVANGIAYVAVKAGGLDIIDVDPPGSASILNTVATSGTAVNVAVSGNYAYVSNEFLGLDIIDLSVPGSESVIHSIPFNNAGAIAIDGNTAYVADPGIGLHVVDITDPPNATDLSTIWIFGGCSDIKINGNYAYIANNYGGLKIILVN